MNKKKSGRPRLSTDEKTVAISSTVKESQFLYLQKLGDGNTSDGVRIVTDAYMERYWPIMKICPDCEFYVDGTCQDLAGHVHSQTGNSVCQYNPYAVLPQKEEEQNEK